MSRSPSILSDAPCSMKPAKAARRLRMKSLKSGSSPPPAISADSAAETGEGDTRRGASAFTSPSKRIRRAGAKLVSAESDDGCSLVASEDRGAGSAAERTLRGDTGWASGVREIVDGRLPVSPPPELL